MIDYIRIMQIIIYFILSTPIPVDEQSFIKSNSIIYIDTPIVKHIALNYNIIDNILFIIVCCSLFSLFIFGLMAISPMFEDNPKINMFIIKGTLISMLICIISLCTNMNLDDKYKILRDNAKLKYNNEIAVSYQLEKANTLPTADLTSDDILKFKEFYHNTNTYDKPEYNKGNLYSLPIITLLQETNIKSIKSLYENIEYLDTYYDNNYIEDERYHWINTQLNAFYSSNPTDNTNISILENLKN